MEKEEKFYGVNYPHTVQLHDQVFYLGMEVHSIETGTENVVMMFSPEQIEQVFFYYKKLKLGEIE